MSILKRSMVFIDGENLVMRYQDMLSNGWVPKSDVTHTKDVFVWSASMIRRMIGDISRVTYYTSAVGDEETLNHIREAIQGLEYSCHDGGAPGLFKAGSVNPLVFKKARKTMKSRQVDLRLAIDIMEHSANGSCDDITIVSGDGDFVPLVEAVMRRGVLVSVWALSSGLSPGLRWIADTFDCIDDKLFASDPAAAAEDTSD